MQIDRVHATVAAKGRKIADCPRVEWDSCRLFVWLNKEDNNDKRKNATLPRGHARKDRVIVVSAGARARERKRGRTSNHPRAESSSGNNKDKDVHANLHAHVKTPAV